MKCLNALHSMGETTSDAPHLPSHAPIIKFIVNQVIRGGASLMDVADQYYCMLQKQAISLIFHLLQVYECYVQIKDFHKAEMWYTKRVASMKEQVSSSIGKAFTIDHDITNIQLVHIMPTHMNVIIPTYPQSTRQV